MLCLRQALIIALIVTVVGTVLSHIVADHLHMSESTCPCGSGAPGGPLHAPDCPLFGHRTAVWCEPYFWPMVATLFVSGFAAGALAPSPAGPYKLHYS